jgi:hypothetical protein
MTALDHALELARRGLSVIPVPRPRAGVEKGRAGDGKVPVIPWKLYQQERATEAELREWFATEQNLAIVTGAVSGVVVVDVDSLEALQWIGARLPRTPWQVRTSRGFHLYYRHPGRTVRNLAQLDTGSGRIALDVRGDGGYVIGPGSVHACGHGYSFAGDWSVPRDQIPTFWVGWLERPKTTRRPTPPSSWPTGDVVERARRYLGAIPPPVIGEASDTATLYAACKLVRGFGLTEADATSLLWEWAGGRPGWTREWVEQKVANALRYGEEPIGGLR